MNTPNKLTIIRILLVPFFMFFLLAQSIPHRFLLALIVFAIASITDHFDGKIARERGLITNFGKFADPLADKIMVMAAFMCFVQLGIIGATVVIIMIMREFIVTSIRLVAADSGKVIAANSWGKSKTVSQILAILIVISLEYIKELISMKIIPMQYIENFIGINSFYNIIKYIGNGFVWISAILTILSGIIYLWDNKEFIKNAK